MEIRKIIHIDMDAFFASVEIRDNPGLRGKPVIVGGPPGSRGVVCTASYEARKYGVHSAMSANRAFELCPRGIFLTPRMDAYKQVSWQIHQIFLEYTDLVEQVSIDEAYLDVSVNKKGIPYAVRTAKEIRRRITQETGGLTASAGVSFNKFLAKMASDLRKPNGMAVILPDQAQSFLDSLPVEQYHGVGKATAKRMAELGIRTGADLRQRSKLELSEAFGPAGGAFYYDIVRGIDLRPVIPERERKSLGTEETFAKDTADLVEMADTLRKQSAEVAKELAVRSLAGRTVTLKVKFHDFRCITRSKSLPILISDADTIFHTAADLLSKTEAGQIEVRLLGVTVSGFPEEGIMRQQEFPFMKQLPRYPDIHTWGSYKF